MAATYFVQECPTCGRNLQVRVEYMGKRVVCQHCKARFEACDPTSAAYPPMESSLSLLARADQLIESAARQALSTATRTAG
jgi:transposase-like protein